MIPGSVEAWPASQMTSSWLFGSTLCSAQALSIGVTMSNRPWTIQPGMSAILWAFFSSQPSSSKKPLLMK